MRIGIVVYLILSLCCLTAFTKTISVGNGHQYHSISKALEKTRNGDTLLIHKGVYKEKNIVIDKAITIKGINNPVLDGENKYEILTIKSDNVKVAGLTFSQSGKSSLQDLAAIKLLRVKDVTISDNTLLNNYFGIYLANSNNCLITKNKIKGAGLSQQSSGNGIHLWKCKNINIIRNESRGHRDGIYFEFVTESNIRNNISENNLRYGLHFMFSDNDSYEGNTFKSNGAGVAVMYTKNVKMKHNHFLNNWGSGAYGILLKDIRDSEIEDNVFEGNTTGIYAESASRIHISKNEFIRNGWALRITSSCDGLTINTNNFIGNTFDMASTSYSNITVNSFDGNYWDKYDGYDLDKNTKGDVPYYPVSLSTMLVEKAPTSTYFLHSFVLDLINQSEKMLPNIVPEGIKDSSPLMKKIAL